MTVPYPTGVYQIQRGQVLSRGLEGSAPKDISYGFSFNAKYTYLDFLFIIHNFLSVKH